MCLFVLFFLFSPYVLFAFFVFVHSQGFCFVWLRYVVLSTPLVSCVCFLCYVVYFPGFCCLCICVVLFTLLVFVLCSCLYFCVIVVLFTALVFLFCVCVLLCCLICRCVISVCKFLLLLLLLLFRKRMRLIRMICARIVCCCCCRCSDSVHTQFCLLSVSTHTFQVKNKNVIPNRIYVHSPTPTEKLFTKYIFNI